MVRDPMVLATWTIPPSILWATTPMSLHQCSSPGLTGRKYYLESAQTTLSANEQPKWPQKWKSKKSRLRAREEEGVKNSLRLSVSPQPLSEAYGYFLLYNKGLSPCTMEKLKCKTLQGKLQLFLGVRGSVLICKQYPLFSWVPSPSLFLSSPQSPPSPLPPFPPSLFRGNFRWARFSLRLQLCWIKRIYSTFIA